MTKLSWSFDYQTGLNAWFVPITPKDSQIWLLMINKNEKWNTNLTLRSKFLIEYF